MMLWEDDDTEGDGPEMPTVWIRRAFTVATADPSLYWLVMMLWVDGDSPFSPPALVARRTLSDN